MNERARVDSSECAELLTTTTDTCYNRNHMWLAPRLNDIMETASWLDKNSSEEVGSWHSLGEFTQKGNETIFLFLLSKGECS